MRYIRHGTHYQKVSIDFFRAFYIQINFFYRCKLFYKKDKEFAEKGLGMLYLKKVDENEEESNVKTQLLVRADTNLGNILLNIMLNKQMSLLKRNNCIQFVCIPNPEIPGVTSGSPVSMLIKVKNADQANILEDELKKRIDMI